jgi:hypothetical protein
MLVAFAIGLYQAFAMFFATLVLGAFLIDLLDGQPMPRALRGLLIGGFVAAASAALYGVITWAALALSGQELTYVQTFIRPDRLIADPLDVLGSVAEEAGRTYFGHRRVYGGSVYFLSLPTVFGLITVAVLALGFSAGRRLLVLGASLGLFFAPFAVHLIYAWQLPARTLVAVPAAVFLLGLVGFTRAPRRMAHAALALLPITYFQLFYANSLLSAPRTLVQVHDAALASALYQDIGRAMASAPTAVERIDLFGGKRFSSEYRMPFASTIGASFFGWGHRGRILAYMRLIGLQLPDSTDDEQHRALFDSYLAMPPWPAVGSIKVLGNVLLVKLSETPLGGEDWLHWIAVPERRLGAVDPPALYRLNNAPDDSWLVDGGADITHDSMGISFVPGPTSFLTVTFPNGTLGRCMHLEAQGLIAAKSSGQVRLLVKPIGQDLIASDTPPFLLDGAPANGAQMGFQKRHRLGFEDELKYEISGLHDKLTIGEIELRCLAWRS